MLQLCQEYGAHNNGDSSGAHGKQQIDCVGMVESLILMNSGRKRSWRCSLRAEDAAVYGPNHRRLGAHASNNQDEGDGSNRRPIL